MCGIAGWIDWETDLTTQRDAVEQMSATMACRGPDARGVWLSRRAAFGHRRLIVIDPDGGGQPMRCQLGEHTYTITYNGELYNMPDLRRDLTARGHVFGTQSDTEVVLRAYVEWRETCVDRLNGIFAFGVWDDAEERLFLARDRLGVKPLFFTKLPTGIAFGSELKALLAHPNVEPEVGPEGLAEVLVMGPGRTPGHGVFRGIEELRAGCTLSFDRSSCRIRPYWRLQSRPHEDDLETTAAHVRALLRDTVERQLISDVPVCTLLSGGLDSSAITAFAAGAFADLGRPPLHTFSVDYAGNDRHFRPDDFQPNADGPWARRVATAFGTVHHEVEVENDELAQALELAVRARDLPGQADVDTSLYLFCRAIKRQATVALSGESADEIFGGYPWFHRPDALQGRTFPWMQRTHERFRLYSPDVLRMMQPDAYARNRLTEALSEVPRLDDEAPNEARMREMLYLNITRWLPNLLDRKDRMSMAVGLEVRVPFCDHRLVSYVWNIPWSMKTCGGMPKGMLRKALDGILPRDVLQRAKSPYPKTHNPAYARQVEAHMQAVLEDPNSPLLDVIDVDTVRAVARDAQEFDIPWFGQLMRRPQLLAYLIQVDLWMRMYRVRIVS